jgi:hypothetical protein
VRFPGASTKTSGRLAAVLLVGGALLTGLTVLLPQPPGAHRPVLLIHAGIATVLGAVGFVLPWHRWPGWAILAFPAVAFALVGSGNALGGGQPYTLGVYFALIFAWIGATQRRWISLLASPFATATYLASVLSIKDRPVAEASSVAFVIPACVLLGESLAWLRDRLRKADTALTRERSLLEVMSGTAIRARAGRMG